MYTVIFIVILLLAISIALYFIFQNGNATSSINTPNMGYFGDMTQANIAQSISLGFNDWVPFNRSSWMQSDSTLTLLDLEVGSDNPNGVKVTVSNSSMTILLIVSYKLWNPTPNSVMYSVSSITGDVTSLKQMFNNSIRSNSPFWITVTDGSNYGGYASSFKDV